MALAYYYQTYAPVPQMERRFAGGSPGKIVATRSYKSPLIGSTATIVPKTCNTMRLVPAALLDFLVAGGGTCIELLSYKDDQVHAGVGLTLYHISKLVSNKKGCGLAGLVLSLRYVRSITNKQ